MAEYETLIDSPEGYCVARCTDEQIDRLPEGSIARFLRDELRAGVYVTPAEIAKAYFGEGGRRHLLQNAIDYLSGGHRP